MKTDRQRRVILSENSVTAIIKVNKAIELLFEIIKLIHSMNEKEFDMLVGSLELTYKEMTGGSVVK